MAAAHHPRGPDPGREPDQCVLWYSWRWRIERLHFVLKSGCAYEKLQLETAERLWRALAIYLIVAWRVLYIDMVGRTLPTAPCNHMTRPALPPLRAATSGLGRHTPLPRPAVTHPATRLRSRRRPTPPSRLIPHPLPPQTRLRHGTTAATPPSPSHLSRSKTFMGNDKVRGRMADYCYTV